MMRPERQMARGRSSSVRARVAKLTFFSAPTLISRSSNPAVGTSRVSMPRRVPIKMTSALNWARSSRAMASAGITCPPVPPPARMARILFRVLRDVEQHAYTRQHDEQRRSPVGNERQWDAFGGQQAQHYADVEQRLHAHHGRDAGGQVAPEQIAGAQSGTDAAIHKDAKQGNDEQRTQQTYFFCQHGKNKVGMRLRQIEQLLLAFHQSRAGQPAGGDRNQRL